MRAKRRRENRGGGEEEEEEGEGEGEEEEEEEEEEEGEGGGGGEEEEEEEEMNQNHHLIFSSLFPPASSSRSVFESIVVRDCPQRFGPNLSTDFHVRNVVAYYIRILSLPFSVCFFPFWNYPSPSYSSPFFVYFISSFLLLYLLVLLLLFLFPTVCKKKGAVFWRWTPTFSTNVG